MIELLLVLAVAGLIVWFVTTYVPMPAAIRSLIIAVAVVCLLLYVLRAFGLVDVRLPK